MLVSHNRLLFGVSEPAGGIWAFQREVPKRKAYPATPQPPTLGKDAWEPATLPFSSCLPSKKSLL